MNDEVWTPNPGFAARIREENALAFRASHPPGWTPEKVPPPVPKKPVQPEPRKAPVKKNDQLEVVKPLLPVLTEQSINFLLLPVNPKTGELNPYAPPLKVIWLLEALMDPIVKDPKPYTSEVIGPDGTKTGIILHFRSAMTEIRQTIGRNFSSKDQAEAFAWLLKWQINWLHEWTQEGKKGGWRRVVIKGTNFISDWDVDVKVRPGRPDDEGNIDVILCGNITPRAVEIVLNNLAHYRLRSIPKAVYQMSEGAQRLYRQGLPYVLSPEGWRLTYPFACRVLGYQEDKDVYNHAKAIEEYLAEIVETVGWRRDKKAEEKELQGQKRPGQDRVWYLKASKQERADWWKRKYRRKKLSESK